MEGLQQILGTLSRVPPPFEPNQHLSRDLGLDSLGMMQLLFWLEHAYQAEPLDPCAFTTVADLYRVAVKHPARTSIQSAPPIVWEAILQEPAKLPLEKRFSFQRGVFARTGVRSLQLLSRAICRILFRLEWNGLERLPSKRGFLLCPNHQSFIDPVFVYAMLPGPLRERLIFIGYGEYFVRAPYRWLNQCGRILLTHQMENPWESFRLAYQGLIRDLIVCLFPEGGRTMTGEVTNPFLGAAILAEAAQVPIVPVAINGAMSILSNFNPGIRFCKIRVSIGEPFDPGEDPVQTMAMWKSHVSSMLD